MHSCITICANTVIMRGSHLLPFVDTTALTVKVKSGIGFTFPVNFAPYSGYTILFFQATATQEAELFMIETGALPAHSTVPPKTHHPGNSTAPHHHKMWVPIVTAVSAVGAVVTVGGLIWFCVRRSRLAYQPL